MDQPRKKPSTPPMPPSSGRHGHKGIQKDRRRTHASKASRSRYIADMVLNISLLKAKKDNTKLEQTIFHSFMELGGIYVKFLQLIVLKTHFFTTLTPREKMSVYDAVESEPIDIDHLLTAELGQAYKNYLSSVEREPFACGSFGQVYHAQLHDGRHVIVKILRPSLIRYVKGDLRVIGMIVRLLRNRIRIATDVNAFFKDFRDVILRETNYVLEAQNARYFYEYFKDSSFIVIPWSYPELCGKHVIVQDYVPGLAMTDLILAANSGHDPAVFTQQQTGSVLHSQMEHLGRELIKSIFIADRIFGDPHPGNIKLLANNQVALLDFGIAGFPPADRKAFMILMEDVVEICKGNFDAGTTFINGIRFFTPDLYRAINSVSMLFRGGEKTSSDIMQELRNAAQKALETSSKHADLDQLIRNGRISTIMNQVINDGNKFSLNVVMDPGTVVTIRTADGYVSLLEELGMLETHIPHVIEAAIKETNDHSAILKGRSETMDFEMAVNVLGDWTQGLIESDPMFFAPLIQKLRFATRNPTVQYQDQEIKEDTVEPLTEENTV